MFPVNSKRQSDNVDLPAGMVIAVVDDDDHHYNNDDHVVTFDLP